MKQAIVLDWDGVVFSDDWYKQAFVDELTRHGSADEIEELYQLSKDLNGYNDQRLAQAVAHRFGVDVQSVQAQMDTVLKRTADDFIFDDARTFITKPPTDIPLIVLTAGDERLQ